MFLYICFNILIFLIAKYAELLFFSFSNKLSFFLKLVKNIIILIVFDTFTFKAN